MLTRKQLATELQVNYYTLVRWDKVQKIPRMKIGRQYRYDLEEVKKALREQ